MFTVTLSAFMNACAASTTAVGATVSANRGSTKCRSLSDLNRNWHTTQLGLWEQNNRSASFLKCLPITQLNSDAPSAPLEEITATEKRWSPSGRLLKETRPPAQLWDGDWSNCTHPKPKTQFLAQALQRTRQQAWRTRRLAKFLPALFVFSLSSVAPQLSLSGYIVRRKNKAKDKVLEFGFYTQNQHSM
jgi:hypothetical protein